MKSSGLLISACVFITAILTLNPSIAKADILVYDNNNQYLGIMTNLDSDEIDLFIPSLSSIFTYETSYSDYCGDELQALFESNDCSGTPYADDPYPVIYDFSPTPRGGGFYKTDYTGKKTFTPGSHYNFSCECEVNTFYPSAEYYPWIQVQMPFTTPVAMPLRFKVHNKVVVIPLN
jgi:hypothetical protein